MKHVSSVTRALLLVGFTVFVQPQMVWSADDGKPHDSRERVASTDSKLLSEQLASLRIDAALLEAALKEKHQGQARSATGRGEANLVAQGEDLSRSSRGEVAQQPGSDNAMSKGKGMKPKESTDNSAMSMKGMSGMGMSMMGGKRMDMMGRVPKIAGMALPSALPGFPGASHIYHIGSTGFFLDHSEHITLSQEQETKLNQYKERALLRQATFDRQIEEAEQELWILTASDEPDAAKIDAQVRKIATLQGDQRIAFIRAVGEAAKVLVNEQRERLVGQQGEERR